MTTALTSHADLDRLNRRYQGVQMRFASLQGQARELGRQQERLTKSISLAKAREALAPQAAEVFTYLQEKAHRRAVGDFEDLLSAFVADVIPGSGRIRLELGTERGAPSLEINIDNGGDPESVFEGNGGGLTNVVGVGLAYSALSRTKNRQFMLLDEPDCWLQAANVPAFTKVIAEVANPRVDDDGTALAGCQTLMVSHNDISLMDDGAHIQDLQIEHDLEVFAANLGVDVAHVGKPGPCAHVVWVDGGATGRSKIEVRYRDIGGDEESNALTKGYPYLNSVSGSRDWVSDEQVGIRWIEVINLRRHVHTRMDLSSGLNVLTGGVNKGKSTLYFTALRAMAYGVSKDSFIRHGASESIIRMGLEDNVVLEMVRRRKGSPKVVYRLYKDGNPKPVHEEVQGTQSTVPSFITNALRIALVDDLDIQLRNQKQPVFLLNEIASRRAKLLSVGRESGLLQELIDSQRQHLKQDRETIKRDELEINGVNRSLMVLRPLAGMSALVDIMGALSEDASSFARDVVRAKDLIAKLSPLEGKAKLFDLSAPTLSASYVAPDLADVASLATVVADLARNESTARLADVAELPATPSLLAAAELAELVSRLAATYHADKLLPYLPAMPQAQSLVDATPLAAVIAKLDENRAASLLLPALQSVPVAPVLIETTELAALAKQLSGGPSAEMLLAAMPLLPVVPVLSDSSPLRECGIALKVTSEGVAVLELEDKQVTAESTKADTDLHDLKHELGVCPTCTKPF